MVLNFKPLTQQQRGLLWVGLIVVAVLVLVGLANVNLAHASETRTIRSYYHLPDPVLTPGAVATTDTALVCQKGYTERARVVPRSRLNKVYQNYGVEKSKCRGGCKIDHLIPLAVGGSNDIENLWPHEYRAEWTVYEKTRLEVRLRKEVCNAKSITIQEAQACFRDDWTRCHARYFPGDHEARLKRERGEK
jgi:hypothetical protein